MSASKHLKNQKCPLTILSLKTKLSYHKKRTALYKKLEYLQRHQFDIPTKLILTDTFGNNSLPPDELDELVGVRLLVAACISAIACR